MATRRPQRSIIVVAGDARVGERRVSALAQLLGDLGVETMDLGREQSAKRIAAAAAEHRADTLEVCLGGAGAVLLLRELLKELTDIGRRDVSIVVHRTD